MIRSLNHLLKRIGRVSFMETPSPRASNQQQHSLKLRRFASTMNPDWKAPPPCRVGDSLQDIDTPALIIDLDKMDYNLKLMPKLMEGFPKVDVRPHVKAHKCPALAKLQMEAGSCGVCCQTLVEAEAMVYGGGINDVFITNQVIGKAKLKRLAALAKLGDISICVDDANNIQDVSDVAIENNCKIGCVVEVNVGQNRCGVEPGEASAELAVIVNNCPNVFFKGIHCYQGWNQHIRKAVDREQAVEKVADMVRTTLQALEKRGIACDYVTGGGTGTFPYEAKSGVYTEVQPGSYVLMDVDYSNNFGEDGKQVHDFQHSLHVLTTVQSVAKSGERAVVDAGMKAVSMDSGVPKVVNADVITYNIGGDEHGILTPGSTFKVGDLLKLIPGHCDPTVNLYDWLVGVRGDKAEHVWPILGRGPGV